MIINVSIIKQTDVLILGGSTGAVEAALAAKNAGCDVLIATPKTYLGEDVCGVFDPEACGAAPENVEGTDLWKNVFGSLSGKWPLPMQVKYPLEQAAVEAGVELLYATYGITLLTDEEGAAAGAVVANRSGYQAITARAVIDATPRANALRFAGVKTRDFVPGKYRFALTVLGGAPSALSSERLEEPDVKVAFGDTEYSAYRVYFDEFVSAPDPSVLFPLEARLRDEAWNPDMVVIADEPAVRFPDRIAGFGGTGESDSSGTVLSPDRLPVSLFESSIPGAYVFGASADLDDAIWKVVKAPRYRMRLGRDLGAACAEYAAERHAAGNPVAAYGANRAAVAAGDGTGRDIRREDTWFRFDGAPVVAFDLNRLPLFEDTDVFVAGGGTAGAPAAIAAGRAGSRVVVSEFLPALGGVATEGKISIYYYGNRVGFTGEIDAGVMAMAADPDFDAEEGLSDPNWKKGWYLRELLRSGGVPWFRSLCVAASVDDPDASPRRLNGAVLATPWGYGLVAFRASADSTGNADLCAPAGAGTVTITGEHIAVQGTGVGYIDPREKYSNTDHTFVDETDVFDITRAFIMTREKFKTSFDIAQIVDSRERRQIRGDITLDPVDFLSGRTFPDTVVTAESNFDSHGFTIHPVFIAKAPDHEPLRAHVPFRCLLPAGLDNVLATGLGVSCHRDALPVIRMQPDVQNQGYAVGYICAQAAHSARDTGRVSVRGVDIKAVQHHLVEKGILAPDVPYHEDSFPLSQARVKWAAKQGRNSYVGLSILFSDTDRSRPLLRKNLSHDGVRNAQLLGLMGDDAGVDILVDAVDGMEWDSGWNYRGMGQFGFSLSPVDSMVVALGRTGNPRAVPALIRKLRSVGLEQDFSHYRALVMAFESLPTPEAAPLFAELLDSPAISGSSKTTLAEVLADIPEFKNDTGQRNRELTELLLARGLMACGDFESMGRRVLERYAEDLHGHYARHARALLKAAGRG